MDSTGSVPFKGTIYDLGRIEDTTQLEDLIGEIAISSEMHKVASNIEILIEAWKNELEKITTQKIYGLGLFATSVLSSHKIELLETIFEKKSLLSETVKTNLKKIEAHLIFARSQYELLQSLTSSAFPLGCRSFDFKLTAQFENLNPYEPNYLSELNHLFYNGIKAEDRQIVFNRLDYKQKIALFNSSNQPEKTALLFNFLSFEDLHLLLKTLSKEQSEIFNRHLIGSMTIAEKEFRLKLKSFIYRLKDIVNNEEKNINELVQKLREINKHYPESYYLKLITNVTSKLALEETVAKNFLSLTDKLIKESIDKQLIEDIVNDYSLLLERCSPIAGPKQLGAPFRVLAALYEDRKKRIGDEGDFSFEDDDSAAELITTLWPYSETLIQDLIKINLLQKNDTYLELPNALARIGLYTVKDVFDKEIYNIDMLEAYIKNLSRTSAASAANPTERML